MASGHCGKVSSKLVQLAMSYGLLKVLLKMLTEEEEEEEEEERKRNRT